MGISDKLTKEVTGWGGLILIVVILSIILINFKVDAVCPGGYEINTSVSTTGCVDVTNNSVVLTGDTSNELLSTIDTSVTGLQEPANWTDIVVIVIVAVGILGLILGSIYAMRKTGGRGGVKFN